MTSKYFLICLQMVSLISCSSEEECPVENISGAYAGTYSEKYPFETEFESVSVESLDITISNVSENAAQLTIGFDDPITLDIVTEGCSFTSVHHLEDEILAFKIEGSFENDKLFIEMLNPITIPDSEDEFYDQLESLERTRDIGDINGLKMLEILNNLDGFAGFEEFAGLNGIEKSSGEDVLDLVIDVVDYYGESLTLDLTKIQ